MAAKKGPSYSTEYFPRPTGKYGVGTFDVLPSINGEEPLLIKLYYPCDRKFDQVSPHLLSTWIGSAYLSPLLIRGRNAKVCLGCTIPAIAHQPVMQPTQELSRFPVVVFSHGLIGMRSVNSSIHCDLASHGYIVASVEHKDGSACVSYTRTKSETAQEGQPKYEDKWIEHIAADLEEVPLRYDQVKQRSSEVVSALDFVTVLDQGRDFEDRMESMFDFAQFKSRIDLDRVVVMGHSFGGGTSVVTLATDPRFKCAVCLDSWMFPVSEHMFAKVKNPIVFINSWSFQWASNVRRMMRLVTEEKNNLGFPTSQSFTLRGSSHVSQTDLPFVLPKITQNFMTYRYPTDSAEDGYEVFDASLQLTHAFLRRHLWNDPSPQPILDGGEGQHRLVLSGTNVDLTKGLKEDVLQKQVDDISALSHKL